jgi:putative Mn2+ efflux pump MntP
MVAHISGFSSRLLKPGKGLCIFFLSYTIQYQVLWLGIWTSGVLRPFTQNIHNWLAIGILVTMSIKMFYELMEKRKRSYTASLDTKAILRYTWATAVYTFF